VETATRNEPSEPGSRTKEHNRLATTAAAPAPAPRRWTVATAATRSP